MQLLTVTIGRGDPDSERFLPVERWYAFISAISSLVTRAGFEIVVSNLGTGHWTDPAGHTYKEQNRIVVGIREAAVLPNLAEEGEIIRQLAEMAREYDQDAIALGLGESKLIGKDGAL